MNKTIVVCRLTVINQIFSTLKISDNTDNPEKKVPYLALGQMMKP